MRAFHSTVVAWKAAFSWLVGMNMRLPHPFPQLSSRSLTSLLRRGLLGTQALHFVTILCLLTSVLVACSGERPESFYASLADADKDGAITRGWIPDFLPESSRGIHELHRISGGKTWCAFEFSSGDAERLRTHLKGANALAPSVKHVLNPGVSWWPSVLVGDLDAEKIRRAGFDLSMIVAPETRSSTEVLLFAIDWSRGRGFFSRAHE
jgi:hypothetical protein